jgi:hypothetical protein
MSKKNREIKISIYISISATSETVGDSDRMFCLIFEVRVDRFDIWSCENWKKEKRRERRNAENLFFYKSVK